MCFSQRVGRGLSPTSPGGGQATFVAPRKTKWVGPGRAFEARPSSSSQVTRLACSRRLVRRFNSYAHPPSLAPRTTARWQQPPGPLSRVRFARFPCEPRCEPARCETWPGPPRTGLSPSCPSARSEPSLTSNCCAMSQGDSAAVELDARPVLTRSVRTRAGLGRGRFRVRGFTTCAIAAHLCHLILVGINGGGGHKWRLRQAPARVRLLPESLTIDDDLEAIACGTEGLRGDRSFRRQVLNCFR